MQELRKPPHSSILSSLQGFLLFLIGLIASCGKSVRHAGKELVVIFDVQARNHAVGIRFHFVGKKVIMFRSDNLNGHGDVGNFLLCQRRRVSGGDAVDQIPA